MNPSPMKGLYVWALLVCVLLVLFLILEVFGLFVQREAIQQPLSSLLPAYQTFSSSIS